METFEFSVSVIRLNTRRMTHKLYSEPQGQIVTARKIFPIAQVVRCRYLRKAKEQTI